MPSAVNWRTVSKRLVWIALLKWIDSPLLVTSQTRTRCGQSPPSFHSSIKGQTKLSRNIIDVWNKVSNIYGDGKSFNLRRGFGSICSSLVTSITIKLAFCTRKDHFTKNLLCRAIQGEIDVRSRRGAGDWVDIHNRGRTDVAVKRKTQRSNHRLHLRRQRYNSSLRVCFIMQGSHWDWKTWKKWEGIFQWGNLEHTGESGKIIQNTAKVREFQTNVI